MTTLVVMLVAIQLLALASTVHAIMNTRTAQGTIGWAVALNTVPALSLPAYWMIGQDRFDDHVTAHRRGGERVSPIAETLLKDAEAYRVDDQAKVDAVRTAENLAALPVLRGNDTELLIDGRETFDSIFEGIRSAENYILMQWFIVRDDELGTRMQQALIDKAREGVDVYFIYDAFGSISLDDDYVNALRAAGVDARAFRADDSVLAKFQFNFRNHRKVTVVDGETAWIGGHNLGDEYLGQHEKLTPWRDAHVKITGPAALMPQLAFATDWNFMAGEVPSLDWRPRPASTDDEAALVVASGPADELEVAKLMFVHAINSAEDRIWIASPYYVPDEAVIAALQLAGLRGVDVRILIPKMNDHLLVNWTAWSYFRPGGLTGVKFYWYRDGFMHRKAMLVDDVVAAIGSANFDNRSFRLNFEITGLFMSDDMIGQVEDMFVSDFAKSDRIEPDIIESRSFWFRFAVNAARLAAPVL